MIKNINFRMSIFTLFFLSGISGLIYELIWTRLLTTVFGSSIEAITIVISVFMGGLALGSLIFGKIIDNLTKITKLSFYAYIEIGIAISAGLSFFTLPLIRDLYFAGIDLIGRKSITLDIFRILCSILILIIPTLLMGGTLPVLCKAFIKDSDSISKETGFLYGINTLGAVSGIILAGFLLIEKTGLINTMFIAAGINIFIGTFIYLKKKSWETLTFSTQKNKKHEKKSVQEKPSPRGLYYSILVIYGVSGLIALAFETLWTRALIFFIGSSTYAFSIILIIFLAGITFGSIIISSYIDKISRPIRLFAILEAILGLIAISSLYFFKQYTNEIIFDKTGFDPIFIGSLGSSIFVLFAKTFLVVFPAALILGMLFPIVNKICINNLQDLGKNIGKIYFSNTIGTIFGSIFATYIFIPFIGVSYSILFFGLLNILLSFILINFIKTGIKSQILFYSIPAIFALILIFQNPFIREFKSDTERSGDKTIYYKEDISATVKVYQSPDGYKSMSVNGMMIGGTQPKTMRKQIMLAHLPMLFHPNPKKVLTVGLGTGITFSELSLYKPERLDCVEIADAVKVAAGFFNNENRAILIDKNANIFIEDGRNFLAGSHEKYDVIIDDSMLRRESAGNGPLYSDEYYRDCTTHMNDNGIFCQWLPLYLEKRTYQTILRTLRNNFKYINLFYLGHAAVVQIATNQPLNIDIDKLIEKVNAENINTSLKQVEMNDIIAILKCYLLGNNEINSFIGAGNLNSDDYPVVEFQVPKEAGLVKTFSDNLLELSPKRSDKIPAIYNFSNSPNSELVKNVLIKNWNSFHFILSGSILTHAGDIKSGTKKYIKALEIDPNDKHAIYFLEIGESELPSKRASGLLEVGNYYLTEKNVNKALEFYQRSILSDSTFANAYNTLANLYFDLGKTGMAIQLGEKSIQIIPDNPILMFNLASYYEEDKQYKKAYDLYKKVLFIDPSNTNAREGLENCRKHIE